VLLAREGISFLLPANVTKTKCVFLSLLFAMFFLLMLAGVSYRVLPCSDRTSNADGPDRQFQKNQNSRHVVWYIFAVMSSDDRLTSSHRANLNAALESKHELSFFFHDTLFSTPRFPFLRLQSILRYVRTTVARQSAVSFMIDSESGLGC
jgi:hypothetical protein